MTHDLWTLLPIPALTLMILLPASTAVYFVLLAHFRAQARAVPRPARRLSRPAQLALTGLCTLLLAGTWTGHRQAQRHTHAEHARARQEEHRAQRQRKALEQATVRLQMEGLQGAAISGRELTRAGAGLLNSTP